MVKNFYISTPIYYPSAKPHMGHAYSSIVADVFARFKRIDGFKVHFSTGTDEHGLKIQRSAEKNNMEPLLFCNKISKTFENLSKTLNLSNTDFVRTTEERHVKAVKHIWNILKNNGDIYLSKYSGWYSVSDEAFYNEDEISEKNGKKICTSSGSIVEWVEEESYFFRLSKWQDKLLDYYEKNKNFILPLSRKNEVLSFVKSGLKDLSISRKSFSWGIKVPDDPKHVIYVWLDALTNYLSSLNYPDTKDPLFRNFWPANIHLIGKDILRFHAIYWPAFLLAANIPLPLRIYGHGWILSGDEKMSKSKGNILDPLDIIDIYGLDPLRYYLIKEVSFGSDGNITINKLEDCINSDLANNYGNLCQRVTSFCEKNYDLKIPNDINFSVDDLKILNNFNNNIKNLRAEIDNQNLNFYINFIINALFDSNKYFNDQEPWKKKEDTKRRDTIVYVALELIRKISILLYPIIPNSSLKALEIFSITEKSISLDSIVNHSYLKSGDVINKIGILFKKIDKDKEHD
jgi:methionyl-tRNA synthetase